MQRTLASLMSSSGIVLGFCTQASADQVVIEHLEPRPEPVLVVKHHRRHHRRVVVERVEPRHEEVIVR